MSTNDTPSIWVIKIIRSLTRHVLVDKFSVLASHLLSRVLISETKKYIRRRTRILLLKSWHCTIPALELIQSTHYELLNCHKQIILHIPVNCPE